MRTLNERPASGAGWGQRHSTHSQASLLGLYRAGAWSALAYVVLVLTPLALLATAPLVPDSGAEVLEYISAHRALYLTELICFVGLSIPAMVVFTATGMALRRADPGLALLGGVLGVGSEITALAVGGSPQSLNGGLLTLSDSYQSATSTAERAGLAHAADAVVATTNAMPWAGVLTAVGILLLSLAMWHSEVPRSVAAFGIVTGALGIPAEALRPVIGAGYLLYGLLLPIWFVLIGRRLHRLCKEAESAGG